MKDKSQPVKVGETISYRIPDEKFAELFNLGMKATGATRANLSSNAVESGMAAAVWKLSDGRETALKEFQNAIKTPAVASGEEAGFSIKGHLLGMMRDGRKGKILRARNVQKHPSA